MPEEYTEFVGGGGGGVKIFFLKCKFACVKAIRYTMT